jgi:hypothetical protein
VLQDRSFGVGIGLASFRKISTELSMTRRQFNVLSRIDLACAEAIAAARISDAMSVIEHEWERHLMRRAAPMIIFISEKYYSAQPIASRAKHRLCHRENERDQPHV